jgi:formate hydrogenlyase subunit 4
MSGDRAKLFKRIASAEVSAMINWLVRPIMIVAAVIAGWFVARDAVNFSIIQLVVALLLVTALVGLAAIVETLTDRADSNKRPK